MLFNLQHFLVTASYLGVFGMLFGETGLLVGFILPGDSLLVTAGILAAAGTLSLPLVALVSVAAAIIGDSVGYEIGKRVGPRLFRRPKSRFFNPKNVERARAYFDRYGAKTLVLARFIPVVRTFAPPVAGVAKMPYRRFLSFNAIGGLLWGAGVPTAAYFLGQLIPNLDRYLLLVIGVVIVVSLIPVGLELLRGRKNGKNAS